MVYLLESTSAQLHNIRRPTDHERPNEHDALQFQIGDVVIFEERRSPWTGSEHDADPNHRHAVRLTAVDYEQKDALFDKPLLKISWDKADALPFTLWINKPPQAIWDSSQTDESVAVALGNIILADHGRSIHDDPTKLQASHGPPPELMQQHYPAPKVSATLSARNLTYSDQLPTSGAPAAKQLVQDPRRATPQLLLRSQSSSGESVAEYSLLELRDLRRIAKRLVKRVEVTLEQTGSKMSRSVLYAIQAKFQCGCDHDHHGRDQLVELVGLQNAIRHDLHDIWFPKYDLIDSGPDDSHFVVEMSDDRRAQLRFGQHGFGRTPKLDDDPKQAELVADYRVGNGSQGNLAAGSISGFGSYGTPYPQITAVCNPLPAAEGRMLNRPSRFGCSHRMRFAKTCNEQSPRRITSKLSCGSSDTRCSGRRPHFDGLATSSTC